ncbi:PolC-type DNA polymerase III [Ureaplasma ceti]|uniref:DNA polymerase III PolC-type n=1 Tax=Ureaplasma ceti TaxID=3119530 RepID=A0ABP9U5U0_9BACT
MHKLPSVLASVQKFDNLEVQEILANVRDCDYYREGTDIVISLFLNGGLRIGLIEKIYDFNQRNNGLKFNIQIELEKLDRELIQIYVHSFLKTVDAQILLKAWTRNDFLFDKNTLVIRYITENEKSEWLKVQNKLIQYFNEALYVYLQEVKYELNEEYHQVLKEQQMKYQEAAIKAEKQHLEQQKQQPTPYKTSYSSKYEPSFKDQATAIAKLVAEDQTAVIEGEIFTVKKDVLRSGSLLFTFGVTDYTSSIFVKQYAKADAQTDLDDIKVGDWIRMKINLENYSYDGKIQLSGKLRQWSKINSKKSQRSDLNENKRVEFCVHSKMTAFDGLISASDLIKKVTDYGHSAVAITDRYNVQMFPEIMKNLKGSNIKPIYGIEFEKLPDEIPAVLNPSDKPLLNTRYIVFDLETTGLYAQNEDVIEFGAVVYENNVVVENKQFFIKPTKAITPKISELTSITAKDVENAVDQKTGLQMIVDYIKDDPLVAHNGINFDFTFLNTKLEQYGLPLLTNPIIDTMVISRAINEGYKSNTLEYICKKNKITYDREDAHRADYDAKVLTDVWNVFINRLSELGCHKINEINQVLQNKNLRSKSRGDFVLVYAKNQTGIRDIYELVSLSHSKQFFDRPTLFESDLLKFRDNLLVANSPIESDVLNAAISKDDHILETTIAKYDFITIAPVSGLQHEIKALNIKPHEVEIALERIIKFAQKAQKDVIAVSNAYYLDPVEEQYHEVYIHIPVLNRRKHRFYKYNCGPVAHFRTTDEMLEEFSFLNDGQLIQDIVINNTQKIASQIDMGIEPLKKKLYPPHIDGVNDKVTQTVYDNAHRIYGENLPEIVEKQIQKELNSIIGNGYAVVYWISHLLVEKSIKDGYVVGSRGSVGSSLVATFLNITDVNALPPHYLCKHCKYSDFDIDKLQFEDGFDLQDKVCPKCGEMMSGEGHQIPFETFLGFNGDKVPDIDLNFSGVYQNKAHNFIKEMFGESKAFRAGTISTVAEKTSFGNVKAYFEEIEKDATNAEVERYAIKCQDVKRTTGQHPGGIVVVPEDMSVFDFTPYNYPADDTTQDWYTTHFAFEYIHDNLLKFDILGHDNPTALRMLKDLTGVDEKDIPNNDPKTMSLFNSLEALGITPDDLLGETTGAISIPEFGTKFVREMLKDTNPQSFADLIRISGLSHGTDVWLGNAKELIDSGKTLKDVIGCRDDIMVYLINHGIEPLLSFKIMEDVRKGKQIKPEAQAVLRDNKIPEWYIESCNKIKYMFPKAHATAYVMHAWKFAWYKINYPLEYYATYFSIRPPVFDVKVMTAGYSAVKERYLEISKLLNNPKTKGTVSNKDKDLLPIYEIALEMYARGYTLKMIDLEKSEIDTFVIDKEEKAIYCPFSSLDGLGLSVAESIVQARKEAPFTSIEDLTKRTKITKTHIQTLKDYKVLDSLSESNQMSLFDF